MCRRVAAGLLDENRESSVFVEVRVSNYFNEDSHSINERHEEIVICNVMKKCNISDNQRASSESVHFSPSSSSSDKSPTGIAKYVLRY